VRLGPRQHLIHAERAPKPLLVEPAAPVRELGEQPLDLHHGPAERAEPERKKRAEDRQWPRILRRMRLKRLRWVR